MHTAVNVDIALVGNGVERGGASADVRHGDGAWSKKWVGTALELPVQSLDSLDKGNGFVEGVVAAFGGAGMAAAPLKGDADLGTPAMAAIDVHLSRFADDDKVRANTLVFNEGVAGDTVAPLLHIAKIIECPVFCQP